MHAQIWDRIYSVVLYTQKLHDLTVAMCRLENKEEAGRQSKKNRRCRSTPKLKPWQTPQGKLLHCHPERSHQKTEDSGVWCLETIAAANWHSFKKQREGMCTTSPSALYLDPQDGVGGTANSQSGSSHPVHWPSASAWKHLPRPSRWSGWYRQQSKWIFKPSLLTHQPVSGNTPQTCVPQFPNCVSVLSSWQSSLPITSLCQSVTHKHLLKLYLLSK